MHDVTSCREHIGITANIVMLMCNTLLKGKVVVLRSSHYNFPVYHPPSLHDKQVKIRDLEGYIKYLSPSCYQDKFKDYLQRPSEMYFTIIGMDAYFKTSYTHRWEKSYRKGILAKMYQLEIWAKRWHLTCGMLSLTSAQTSFTDLEILKRFKDSWSKFADNLRVIGFQYFCLYEPHESGVPHMHVMLFGDCSEEKN